MRSHVVTIHPDRNGGLRILRDDCMSGGFVDHLDLRP